MLHRPLRAVLFQIFIVIIIIFIVIIIIISGSSSSSNITETRHIVSDKTDTLGAPTAAVAPSFAPVTPAAAAAAVGPPPSPGVVPLLSDGYVSPVLLVRRHVRFCARGDGVHHRPQHRLAKPVVKHLVERGIEENGEIVVLCNQLLAQLLLLSGLDVYARPTDPHRILVLVL